VGVDNFTGAVGVDNLVGLEVENLVGLEVFTDDIIDFL
jgi:hypothetical protein